MSTVSGSDSTRPPASGVRLTYDDFVQFPDDGGRHELIDGEHVVTPSPNMKHQAVLRNLAGLVWSYLRTHKVGQVFFAPFDVVFSEFDVVEPDLLFVSKERQSQILTAANVQGAPDLVVEIGSPSTRRRDEIVKRRLYEQFGVAEYWVVDPISGALHVYSNPTDGAYKQLPADTSGFVRSPLLVRRVRILIDDNDHRLLLQ